jgi:hypothetical protein
MGPYPSYGVFWTVFSVLENPEQPTREVQILKIVAATLSGLFNQLTDRAGRSFTRAAA